MFGPQDSYVSMIEIRWFIIHIQFPLRSLDSISVTGNCLHEKITSVIYKKSKRAADKLTLGGQLVQ